MSTDRIGATMTKDHRRVDEHMAQEILLDDPAFLREIVERVVQQVLEAEMTEHIGLFPTSAAPPAPATATATSRGL
jgi:transposase-like protein